jgi:hypothetical protein
MNDLIVENKKLRDKLRKTTRKYISSRAKIIAYQQEQRTIKSLMSKYGLRYHNTLFWFKYFVEYIKLLFKK